MFEAVICDWDGTLADTRRVIVISFQKALGEIDVKVTDEFIARRMGIGAAETFREIMQNNNKPFTEDLIRRLVERKSQVQIGLSGEVKLMSGAVELLEALQGKVKMGLASMNSQSVITNLVKTKNLGRFFNVVLTGDSVAHSKPDPEIFLKTASELKASPEKCVVLEDSIFGVKAAKSAGMRCIAVTTGVYSKEELLREKPDLVVKTLEDKRIVPFILR